jgi:ubiquinone/menaquinone biosynthesis C-methylase UbiE
MVAVDRNFATADDFQSQDEWARWVKSYYVERESYDWVDVADNWRGPESLFHRYRARVVKDLISQHLGDGLILDAGCGTGLNLRSLPAGSVALDINPRNISLIASRYPDYRGVLGDVEAIPFGDGTFSGVVCTEVLEHVPDADQALREIYRVLKPGGVLLGSVPSVSPIWKLRFVSRTCHASEPFHNQYRRSEVADLLSGFETASVQYSVAGTNVVFVARKRTEVSSLR